MNKRIARYINKILPLYFPRSARFTPRLHLAIWNCGDCRGHSSLRKTLRDIRITIRKDCCPKVVIKKGAV